MRLCMQGRHDRRTKKRQAKDKRRERIHAKMVNMRRNNLARFRPLTWDALNKDALMARGEALNIVEGMENLANALKDWRAGANS